MLFLVPPTSAAAAAEDQSTSLTPVVLQLMWKHQFEFAGFYAAIEQGYYQQVGLDVTISEYDAGMDLVKEVVSGDANYGISDSSLIINRSEGDLVVLLANIFQHSPMVLLSLAETEIYSPAQMIGKSMMLSAHEKNNASIIAMLNSESVSIGQMDIKPHSFTLDDLITGKVDVVSAYATNEPGVLNQKKIKYNVIDPINYGIDFYGNNIFTSEKELRDYPQRVNNFLKASLKGWRYALQHQAEIVDVILKKYSTNKSRDALVFEAKTLERFILPEHIPLGTIDMGRMERIVDTYKQLKMLPKDFKLDGFIYRSSTFNKPSIDLSDEQSNWIKNNPKIIIGVDSAWPPFEFINEQGQYLGMGADYLQLIAEQTGLKFEVQNNKNWQEVMENARGGEIDLLPAVMKSQQRSEFLDFSAPHINYPMVIVTGKDAAFISHLDELKHKRVVLVKGYVTEDLLRINHPEIKLTLVKNLSQALKILSSGEADALVDNLASVTHTISQLGITNLRISGTTPYEFALGIAVKKGEKILLSIIQKALDNVSENERQKIRNKWVSVGYSQATDYTNIIRIGIAVILFVLFILFWNWRLVKEVKARKIVEDALRNSESQFRNLVENTNIVAWEVELETLGFTYVSPHAEQMLGYPIAEWKQESFWANHIVNEDREKSVDFCLNETKKGHDHAFDYRMKKADGDVIWLRDIVTVHKDFEGNPVSLSGVFVDIDEGKKYEQALEKAKEEAEKANRIKSEFLATMSHELRTPMNGVLGMAQILKDSYLTKEQEENVEIILRSGNSLLAIINDVLDLSKLEAEKVDLATEVFNLGQLSLDVLDMFKAESNTKKLNLVLEYSDEQPLFFVGDAIRIQQVLINLVGNAVKFTSEGNVRIVVDCKQGNNQHIDIVLSVNDTGIGVSAKDVQYLFEPFRQADQSTTRQFGGTGLGLSVSKKLIELMGGSIGVESELGKGSTFWVRLCLPEASQPSVAKEDKTELLPVMHKLAGKVLLVEDDPINQLVALGVLRKFGLQVDLAEDGQQAINLWQKEGYDLILMDCRMPVLDGYKATEIIRAQETGKFIPIIALTANSSPDDKRRCLDVGMNDVITKPFKTSVLHQCLGQWLAADYENKLANKFFDGFSGVKLPRTGKVEQKATLDLNQFEKFRDEMAEDYNDILSDILQGFESFFMQIEESNITMHHQELAVSAHNLKSRACYLGAFKLGEIAAEIERLADKQQLEQVALKVNQLKDEYRRAKNDLDRVEI